MTTRPLLLLSIAWRNLGRNRRRTVIAGSGIALGVGMCIATFGLAEGMNSDMVQSVTDVQLGHVQVHAPGFSTHPKLDLAIDDARARVRAADETDGVQGVSPRAYGWALASTKTGSGALQLVGVDPRREAAVTHLDRRLAAGRYLREKPTPWPKQKPLTAEQRALDRRLTERATERAAAEIEALGGSPAEAPAAESPPSNESRDKTRALLERIAPVPDEPPPVLLGDKLARKLHAEPGSLVGLMAQDLRGDPVDVDFRVAGITHTGDSALDTTRAVANLTDVQRFFGLGDRVHEIAIRVGDPDRAAAVSRRLSEEPLFQHLEVKTWKELRPDVVAMVQTNTSMTALLILIVFAVAGIGVADTILMAVFERRRELGMLKAVGMRPAAIVLMVSLETLVLALGASLAGLGLGAAIDLYLARLGIPLGSLGAFTLANATIQPVLHATITAEGLVLPVVFMIGMALLAAVWPALTAARTEPVVAMRER